MRSIDVCEITKPIASPIRNAYIDFSKMTASLVAVVTDVVRDGRRVVGYGFNSNGRYGQGGLIRERFRDRILEAAPESLLDESGDNLDPHKIWATMMMNEKPGGHGERSVAVGTLDMAIWDATAKIAGKPLFRLLAERKGREANPRVFVYAAGGYYYPGKDDTALRAEMRSYLDRGYNVVKMKIGGVPIDEDQRRIEAVLTEIGSQAQLAVDVNGRFDLETGIAYAKMLRNYPLFWYEEVGDPLNYVCSPGRPFRVLSRPDGDRREPVLAPGCAQPPALRRDAARPRFPAVRLCPVLRPGRIPAHPRRSGSVRLVAVALHPARRTPDVAQHRRRPRSWRQRELPGPVPALRRLPRRCACPGWAHHHARVARHRFRGQIRPDQSHARTGRVIVADSRA